jgi:hypothetical protein
MSAVRIMNALLIEVQTHLRTRCAGIGAVVPIAEDALAHASQQERGGKHFPSDHYRY